MYTQNTVTEHLLPANNAGRMNLVEQQLAAAQQTNPPPLSPSVLLPRTHKNTVPEHLLPGNNAGQMNWAEQQLAAAQQTNRPLSDLPVRYVCVCVCVYIYIHLYIYIYIYVCM